MTLEMLERLWYEVEPGNKKPRHLQDMIHSLCEHFLGKLSEEEWQCILTRREAIVGKARWRSVVDENEEVAQQVVGEKDHEEVRKQGPKNKSLFADDVGKAGSSGDGGNVAASSSGHGKASSSGDGKKKIVAKFNEKHYSQAEASAWLPKVKGVSISPVNNRTWQVKYLTREVTPKSHTRIYHEPEGSHKEHCKALVACLTWAWTIHHQEKGGEPCPYDFGELAA